MTTPVLPLPTRVEHSTTSTVAALQSIYGASVKVPPDPVVRQIAQIVQGQFGNFSPQAQSDIFLAQVREAGAK